MEKIWCKGKDWDVNEYNKRLSEENRISDELDKKKQDLDEEEKKRIEKVWEK